MTSRVAPVLLLASIGAALAGCAEDTLYPAVDVGGGQLTLVPHRVSVQSAVPERMEFGDTGEVVVTARSREGAPGIRKIGATVLVMNRARDDTIVVRLGPAEISPERIGPVERSFRFGLEEALAGGLLDRQRLPAELIAEVHGYALSAEDTCAAAVEAQEQQLPCAEVQGARIAAGASGQRLETTVVAGTSVRLPSASETIGDMVVDAGTGQVFLSNRPAHRIEVLDLSTMAFRSPVRVGSEPAGLAFNRTGDTLIVANSGGNNVSFVPTKALREDLARRFEIPAVTLYEVPFEVDMLTQQQTYSDILFFNFADRPQFVAQDAHGRLLYSAISTRAAPVGTIRLGRREPGWDSWDAELIFHERAVFSDSSSYAIANADDIEAFVEGVAIITDHVPGMVPRIQVSSDPLPIPEAAAQLNERCFALHGRHCDVRVRLGKWNLPDAAELSDTTFVAASGDRSWVAFGEGVRTPAGRIILWNAEGPGRLSRVEDIADVVNNTSDRIVGVDLNGSGSLGVARGTDATYFFGNDLRLQGLSRPQTGSGAAFLPGSLDNRTLAFVGTQEGSVQVLETTHYTVVGTVPLRDGVIGPFRVTPPLPGSDVCPPNLKDPAASPGCVVVRVYGVTAADRLVVVDVLRSDLDLEGLP